MSIELKMNNPVSADYQTQYDAQGRFRVPFDKPSCPLKANTEDADVEALLPSEAEIIELMGGDPNAVPTVDPFKEAGEIALAEAMLEDLKVQVDRLKSGADEAERKELDALGMISDEELSARLRRGR